MKKKTRPYKPRFIYFCQLTEKNPMFLRKWDTKQKKMYAIYIDTSISNQGWFKDSDKHTPETIEIEHPRITLVDVLIRFPHIKP